MDPEVLWNQGRIYYARDLVFAALDRFQEIAVISDPDAARACNSAGVAAMRLGEYQKAESLLNSSLDAARRQGDLETVAKVLGNLTLLRIRTGKADAALQAARMAEEVLGQLPVVPMRSTFVLTLSAIAFGMNQSWAEALVRTKQALSLIPPGESNPYKPMLLNNHGVYLEETGMADEACQAFLEALDEVQRMENSDALPTVCSELAHIFLQRGDWDGAVNYARQALDYLWNHMSQVNKSDVARLCELFGRMALSLEDRRRAMALLERAAAYYAQFGLWREWSRSSQLIRSNDSTSAPPGDLPANIMMIMRYFTDLFGLLDTIESADPSLRRRGEIVTGYALRLGESLHADAHEMAILSHAGRLCDIGLTTFEPEAIMDEEGQRYRLHPDLSARWLADFPLPEGVADVVRSHHERYDGQGYPRGLEGRAIPLGARILAVCEFYVRNMQSGMSHDNALLHLQKASGAALDPALVSAFVELHRISN